MRSLRYDFAKRKAGPASHRAYHNRSGTHALRVLSRVIFLPRGAVGRHAVIPTFLLLECVGNSMLLGPVPRKPFGLRGKRIPHLPRIVRSTGTGLNARLRYMIPHVFIAQTRRLSTTWFPTRSSQVFNDILRVTRARASRQSRSQ